MPVLVIFLSWGQGDRSLWTHLLETQLLGLIGNTLILMVGVGLLSAALGLGLAALVTLYDFPGRKQFEWLLMLPLAIPAYVIAFVYIGFFDFAGPVQTWLRDWFGSSAWFPDIRSSGGVVLVFSLVLYPYVYMLTRSALARQGQSLFEASRSLGLSPREATRQILLPSVRPAVVAGVSLVLMETLADFGTVSVFNFSTFTTAIYKSWYGFRDLHIAGQLASLLMIFVFVALWLEQQSRARNSYRQQQHRPLVRRPLNGQRQWQAFALCAFVFFLAFVMPVVQLLVWAIKVWGIEFSQRYWQWTQSTLLLGAMAGVLTIVAALVMGFRNQMRPGPSVKLATRVANLGYAVPSSILAVGVMIGFGYLDHWLLIPTADLIGLSVNGMILTGSLIALLMAYGIRFLAVASGPVNTGLQQIKPTLPEAARLLGGSMMDRWRMIHWPYLRPGILTAFLLVLVDVMKEMPATLIMRPFGWETLAIRIYELTSEGEWERAAIPALILALAGLLPVSLLVRNSR